MFVKQTEKGSRGPLQAVVEAEDIDVATANIADAPSYL